MKVWHDDGFNCKWQGGIKHYGDAEENGRVAGFGGHVKSFQV